MKKKQVAPDIKIGVVLKKYPAGTKTKDIDSGKAKPYAEIRREIKQNANARSV